MGGRTQVCLIGGCALFRKVKPQRGGPGVASSPSAPRDGDAHGGDTTRLQGAPRLNNTHAKCQQAPAGRQSRQRKMRGRTGDRKERRACLTASGGSEPRRTHSASGASGLRDTWSARRTTHLHHRLPITLTASSPGAPAGGLWPAASSDPNLPAPRRVSGCRVQARRRPPTPASAPEARPCSAAPGPLPHVLAQAGGTQRH